MLYATAGQGWVFVWMAAAGALIAAWYGVLAGLRRRRRCRRRLDLVAAVGLALGDSGRRLARALLLRAVAAAVQAKPVEDHLQLGAQQRVREKQREHCQ